MILNVIVADQTYPIEVAQQFLDEGEEFFAVMDRDMDKGWQLGRDWVDRPNRKARCQIAANRLLTALENQNPKMVLLMAAYILSRSPGVTRVEIDTSGEIQDTNIEAAAPTGQAVPDRPAAGLSKMKALERAGKEVTKIFKVGKGYRFSAYDPASGQWVDSAVIKDPQDADERRMQAFRRRFEELTEGD
jgi:hypothetical protein